MEIAFSTDPSRLRLDEIHAMLSRVPWSPGITKEEIASGIRYSALVVGAYLPDGTQAGFCRVISDRTRFAYLLDVVVAEKCRKQGVGQAMVRFAISHPDLRHVYQWLLRTSDAHGVYGKCGFTSISDPDHWMGRMQIRPERPVFEE